MKPRPLATLVDRVRLRDAADWLVVAIAVSLPWSTSATGVLIVLWLIAVLPILDVASVGREAKSAAGGLPILLWALAALGMLWADVSWSERLAGLGGFHKLLLVPLLLAHCRRSGRGHWVVWGFIASSAALLAVSWALAFFPGLPRWGKSTGVPVKDYISQSGIFAICALGLLGQATESWRSGRKQTALVLAGAAALFLANILYVATGRTTLVVVAILLLLLGFRWLGWKGPIVVFLIGGVIAGLVWMSSPYLRERVDRLFLDLEAYPARSSVTSAGLRLDFWKQSIGFVAEAPLIGHGTGTIPSLFRRAAEADPGIAVTSNPHGQVLAVAIQLGLLGAVVLIAMWLAHFALFGGSTSIGWFGQIIVVQSFVGSLFNSHLADFSQGWLYVLGVGVLGGMVLSRRAGDARHE